MLPTFRPFYPASRAGDGASPFDSSLNSNRVDDALISSPAIVRLDVNTSIFYKRSILVHDTLECDNKRLRDSLLHLYDCTSS